MICTRCNHELQWGGYAWCFHEAPDCIANLRADLQAVSAARDDALQRLAALRAPIPEATVSALLNDAARHLDARVHDLQRELEAERGRSWFWCDYATRLYDLGMVFITGLMPMYVERIDKEKFALREERARSWALAVRLQEML